jgi:hypothetical protein
MYVLYVISEQFSNLQGMLLRGEPLTGEAMTAEEILASRLSSSCTGWLTRSDKASPSDKAFELLNVWNLCETPAQIQQRFKAAGADRDLMAALIPPSYI